MRANETKKKDPAHTGSFFFVSTADSLCFRPAVISQIKLIKYIKQQTDKDGNKRYVTEIVVESAEFVGAKKEDSSTISKMETDEIKVPQNYESNYEGGNDTSIVLADSDLPF